MKRPIIFKYVLELSHRQTIELPIGYSILTVQFQDGLLCLWAKIDLEHEFNKCSVEIIVHGTGHHDAWADEKYIGTVQRHGMVWHIFERIKE